MTPTLLLALACNKDELKVRDLQVETDEAMVTRLLVSWTTDEPTLSRVQFGVDGLDQETPWEAEASTEHSAVLMGLPPRSTVDLRVEAKTEDGSALSKTVQGSTGLLPSTLPVLGHRGEELSSWTLVPAIGEDTDHTVLILDGFGEVLWYERIPEGQFGSFTAELAPDGASVYYFSSAQLYHSALDGSFAESFDLADYDQHHDLSILPDGTVAFLGRRTGMVGEHQVRGDTIGELDEQGQVEIVWDLFEHLEDIQVGVNDVGENDDFSHANALTYDPDEDAYLVNLVALRRIVSIDRATGETNWFLHTEGLAGLDFPESPGITTSHDMGLVEGGFRLFVNQDTSSNCSSVVELELGETVELRERYEGEVCRQSFALGSAHPMGEGTLVSWSTQGILEELDGDWQSRGMITSELGYAFGYSRPFEGFYPE